MRVTISLFSIFFLLFIGLAGCGDNTGELKISVTDAPADTNYQSIYVDFDRIEVSTSAASGYKATLTLTGNFELFYTDIKDGGEGSIEVLQDGTGGHSFTLSGAGAYTTEVIMGANSEVDQAINAHTTVSFWRSGSTLYYGFIYDN